ncbi:MAG: alkaline phosphatase family protein [Solirubrobacterales bacterium]
MAEKLVLIVVDAMHPGMLRQAMEAGEAPTFAALAERGELIEDMVSSFPSVTPVCCSEMMTGAGPGDHGVIGMNWYHRLERRYIEYGSSFEATRTFGLFRAMYDLVYNMNLDHLSWEVETLFERLGDAGVRTAITPFLIYRGRRRHELGLEGLAKRALGAVNFRHAVWAPDEFFYGDLYASRPTGCGPSFTRPGTRDEYSACVAEELVREGAYDFLLFSLPDNDFHSHRFGPEATVDSIAKADASFARIVEAGGGLDSFLAEHAVILTADHAQSDVEHDLPLADALGEDWHVLAPNADTPEDAEIAVSPTSRAGAVYILDSGPGSAGAHEKVRERLRTMEGVDIVTWLADADGRPPAREGVGLPAGSELYASVLSDGHELRFRPGGQLRDERGGRWEVFGEPEAVGGDVTRGRFESPGYPDALSRLWSALTSPHAGDVLISAADGYECVDWGGVTHAGGGSHGALSREDSLAPLLFVNCGPDEPVKRPWSLRDIAPAVLDHFGAGPGLPGAPA